MSSCTTALVDPPALRTTSPALARTTESEDSPPAPGNFPGSAVVDAPAFEPVCRAPLPLALFDD
jgi:hypothetical protein